jgi:hypothetical protein
MVRGGAATEDEDVAARLPRSTVLPALGVVGLLIVVMAPLTFGAGGLLGGGGPRVVPNAGNGAPICLLSCPAVRPAAASTPAPTIAPAAPAAPGTGPAVARPRTTVATNASAAPAKGGAPPDTGAPASQPVPPAVDQVTGALPIVPSLPLGLPPLGLPGASS